MNNSKNHSIFYLALAGVIALGFMLRFWHLDIKPLWLDEVLTGFLSLGRPYADVPLDTLFPISTLPQLLRLQPNLSCPEIAQAVASQSTHPPLFFCLMHQWLNWTEPLTQPLNWKLRALPALFGVMAIASIYLLNRLAFSKTAGLMGAAFMAVSPFAVYLSQEARHYTLPMLLVTLALLGLIQIQYNIYSQRQLPKPVIWVLWGVVNSIGCYVHYFFILAFLAQLLTLIGIMYWRRRFIPKGSWLSVTFVIIGVAVSYLPWIPVLLGGFGRSETGWLPKPEHIAPLYQTLAGWLSIVIVLPVESQPLWVQIPMVLLTIGFGGWIGWQAFVGIKQLWRSPEIHIATLTLLCFIACCLLEFAGIIYLLGKDITVAPRYNFIYFPAICALLGASLSCAKGRMGRFRKFLPLFLAFLSSIFVVFNLAFQKPFNPQQVARNMKFERDVPVMMVVGYNSFQDVALGLSFALAIDKLNLDISKSKASDSVAFLYTKQGYELVWQKLSKLSALIAPRLHLWVVAPGLRRKDYPQQLVLAPKKSCSIDPTQHYRIGIPYQLYRCK
ncbi:MAG: glycosyltransferase family 39 protein [Potamolinea sp.]